jgi:hypothetical protein
MYRFTIGKQYYTQVSIVHLGNLRPSPNPTIGLQVLSRG